MKNILKTFKKLKSNTSLEEALQIFNENKNTPAYPQSVDFKDCNIDFYGLTKREYFAGLAMQALLQDVNNPLDAVARLSVEMSDKILKELDKK